MWRKISALLFGVTEGAVVGCLFLMTVVALGTCFKTPPIWRVFDFQ